MLYHQFISMRATAHPYHLQTTTSARDTRPQVVDIDSENTHVEIGAGGDLDSPRASDDS